MTTIEPGEYNALPNFAPPCDTDGFYNDVRRERDCMAYLASIIGPTGQEDGGPGLDILEGWCFRIRQKVERLQTIIDRIPVLVEIVAANCGANSEDRPSLYKRGSDWRYHVRRAGNEWADAADPIEAAKQANGANP